MHHHDLSATFSVDVEFAVPDAPQVGRLLAFPLNQSWSNVGLSFSFGSESKRGDTVLSAVDFRWGKGAPPLVSYKAEQRSVERAGSHQPLPFQYSDTPEIRETLLKIASLDLGHPIFSKIWQDFIQQEQQMRPQFETALKSYKGVVTQQKEARDAAPPDSQQHKALEESISRFENATAELEKRLSRVQTYTEEKALDDLKAFSDQVELNCRAFLPSGIRKMPDLPTTVAGLVTSDYDRIGAQRLAQLVNLASAWLRNLIDSVVYLGPLREYPERYHVYSGTAGVYVGKTGSRVYDILFKRPQLLDQVNDQLERFGLGYRLRVAPLEEESSPLYGVVAPRMIDKSTGVDASSVDIGFGFSQLLPVVVQSVLSRDRVVCIEQPEIHLHPRLQAELGSLFADCIGAQKRNQFFIETHSEHLMLRIQKLIRKKELKPNDVAVIYVDPSFGGAKCLELRLDDEGDFMDRWPDGFFEDGYKEIFS